MNVAQSLLPWLRSLPLKIWLIVAILLTAQRCPERVAPSNDYSPVRIEAIEVRAAEFVLRPGLEVEVHIFDARTQGFIGCSGKFHGLRRVTYSDSFYTKLNAVFVNVETQDTLRYGDVKDRVVWLRVLENDSGNCPEEDAEYADDLIGEIRQLDGGNLGGARLDSTQFRHGGSYSKVLQLWFRT